MIPEVQIARRDVVSTLLRVLPRDGLRAPRNKHNRVN